jgi:hypothetical protein
MADPGAMQSKAFWQSFRKKIKTFKTREFNYPGYPPFNYYLVEDEYLKTRIGTVVPKEGTHHSYGQLDKNYLVVSATISPNHQVLTALHEWHEIMNGNHYDAAREERRFAKQYGLEKEYYADKRAQAGRIARRRQLWRTGNGRTFQREYDALVKEIAKQTGLSRGEIQRAIKPVIEEHKQKRLKLKKTLNRNRKTAQKKYPPKKVREKKW